MRAPGRICFTGALGFFFFFFWGGGGLGFRVVVQKGLGFQGV